MNQRFTNYIDFKGPLMRRMLIALVCLLSISGSIAAQKAALDLQMENATVGQVIDKIEEVSTYRFLYNTKLVDLSRRVAVVVKDAPIELALDQLFQGTAISYSVLDNQIALRADENKKKIDGIGSSSGEQRNEIKTITGQIYNQAAEPLVGATIMRQDNFKGTATDINGFFEMKVEDGIPLLISSLGYADQILLVGNANYYEIVMLESAIQLAEVELVSTGYQTLSKERATGSFESINTKTLDRKISQDIFSEIKGEVAGVLFNNTGRGDEIIVRGLSSINANTSPLIVVDGFPIEGGLNTINPNDVASISILKDAAAASIWGIRATNGVIVVVTKSGNRKKPLLIDFSANTAITQKLDLKGNNLGSPQTQIDYNRALHDVGFNSTFQLFQGNLEGFFSELNPITEALLMVEVGQLTEAEGEARISALANIDLRDEYAELFLQPEISSQYNLSLSGGAKKHDYRVSLTYNDNQNTIVNTGSDRFIVNISNNIDITEKLKLRTRINTSFSNDQLPLSDGLGANRTFLFPVFPNPSSILSTIPLASTILDENGGYLPMVGGMNRGFSNALQSQRGYNLPWTYNLKQEFDNNDNVLKNREIRLQSALSYEIVDGLTVDAWYQYETGTSNGRNLHNLNRYFTRNQINILNQLEDSLVTGSAIPMGAIVDYTETNLEAQTFRTQLHFDKTLSGDLHQITALAGYEVRKVINEGRGTRRYGYNDQSLTYVNPVYQTNYKLSILEGSTQVNDPSIISFIENRFISYYANAAYTYDHKYTFSASTRLDDTNLFGASDEYRNIPLYSFGVKWNIVRESFFDSKTITGLKFKATYGTNGNVDTSTSPFLQAGSFNSEVLYNNFSSFVKTVPNPELRLEKTRTVNLGLDVELWNGDLRANIDVYQKNSEDLLSFQALNPTSGVNASLLNIGALSNKGIDMSIHSQLVKGAKFGYHTGVIFSFNDNKLTRVETPNFSVQSFLDGSITLIGQPLRTFYSFNYGGLDGDGKPQFIDGDGSIVNYTQDISNTDALVKEGTTVARYYGSWINEFTFNNWSLRALTIFDAGQKFRLDNYYNPGSSSPNTFSDFNDRWKQEGDENTTDVPGIPDGPFDSFSLGYQFYGQSNKFVDNAATIRLQEIILSYALDRKLLEKLKLQQLQLSVQGNNITVWNFNKWDIDPANQLFPQQPRVTFNVQATF